MKTFFKLMLATAAAAVTLAACQRETSPAADGEQTVRFVAESAPTRTAFTTPDEDGQYPVLWTENDTKVKVSMNLASAKDAAVTPATDGQSAKFEAQFSTEGVTAPYTFYALSPATAGVSISSQYKSWTVQIPADQTPGFGTPDEAAQILAGVSQDCSSLDEVISVNFSHVTAYGCLSLTNLDLTGVAVNGISLTFGTPVAGRFFYYVADTDDHAAGELAENSASNIINLATSQTREVWFACAPADISGKELKVTVNTASGLLEKTITVPANRRFVSGRIAKFSIDMTGATLQDNKVYELVTDAAELTAGSEVIIANAAGDHAISTTQNTNNRAATAVTVEDNKITNPSGSVEILAVEAGTSAGTFAFKGQDGNYLVSENGNNRLKSSEEKTALGSFTVTIDDAGVTKVIATASDRGDMRFNENSGNPIFNCYATTSTAGTPVALYKLVGSGTDEPVFQATLEGADESGHLEVPASTTSATINVIANVDWEISSNDDVEFSQESGNSSASVEVTFAENDTDDEIVYTINIESELGDEFEFVITQAAPAVVGESVYQKVTEITAGKKYIIAALVGGKVLAATPIEYNATKPYGYPAATEVSETDGVISERHTELELTFTAVSGGYSIQQPDGYYWSMASTYNNIQLYNSAQESYIWTVAANSDGTTVDIANTGKSKHIMYDSSHSNFAVYASFGEKNTWPSLYEYLDGETPVPTVATPEFSPVAGEVEAGTVVTISCATEGADIYYTTDGSTPTTSSTKGTSVTVDAEVTIKAIGVKEGMNNSAVASAEYTIKSTTPPTGDGWFKKDIEDITPVDVFVIVGNNGSNYAMSNDNGTSAAPAAVAVSVSSDGNSLTAAPAANLQWNLSIGADGYTFYPNGNSSKWLYVTDTNNGVRVGGTNDNKAFTICTEGYLYFEDLNRYIGIYNSADWRCYTSINANIRNQTFAFFVKSGNGGVTPVPTVSTPEFRPAAGEVEAGTVVTIACATEGADIYYTTDGSTPTTSSTKGTSVTVNAAMTIKAIGVAEGMNNSEVASASYTIKSTTPPSGDCYVKVSSITSGKKYIIVGGNHAEAMVPAEVSANRLSAQAVTISGDAIASTSATDALAVTITKSGDNYLISFDNKYLEYSGSSTGLNTVSTASDSWVVSAPPAGTGTFRFASAAVSDRLLAYRVGSGSYTSVFGGYKDTNITPTGTEYFDLDLYQFSGESDPVVETVATPSFSPAAGAVSAGTVVTISCATSGATIHYTTDGTTPTASSATGTSVTVNAAMTLKAIAVKSGMNDSPVATADYTIRSTGGSSWSQVTALSDLAAGDEIIIVCETNSKAAGPIGSGAKYLSAESVTIADHVIADEGSAEVFTLGKDSAGNWTLTNADGKVLGATAAKSLVYDPTGDAAVTTWTISINDAGAATIASTKADYGRILYNHNSGNARFMNYTSNTSTSMLLPQIYKN